MLTPGFQVIGGVWPSAVTAANILAGTMKPFRCPNGRLSSGVSLSIISAVDEGSAHSAYRLTENGQLAVGWQSV